MFRDEEEKGNASLGQTMRFAFQNYILFSKAHPKFIEDIEGLGEEISEKDLSTLDAYIETIELLKNEYMKTPKNNREGVENSDGILFEIYNEVFEDLFPNASYYSKCVMTGFVMAQLGLIDSEEKYLDKSRNKMLYRRYLGNYVQNRLEHSKYHQR